MNYSKVKTLPSQQFKRLVGIQPSTFAEMLEVILDSIVDNKSL
ncbi:MULTISPECIES: hypothetical protein [Acinetobacter]|nr:hypothetical protein [Acinetobacter bereziniae]ELW86770.1 hypothetical protein ACINWCA92_1376 [Acinetobacter baumannii WC-A-92]